MNGERHGSELEATLREAWERDGLTSEQIEWMIEGLRRSEREKQEEHRRRVADWKLGAEAAERLRRRSASQQNRAARLASSQLRARLWRLVAGALKPKLTKLEGPLTLRRLWQLIPLDDDGLAGLDADDWRVLRLPDPKTDEALWLEPSSTAHENAQAVRLGGFRAFEKRREIRGLKQGADKR